MNSRPVCIYLLSGVCFFFIFLAASGCSREPQKAEVSPPTSGVSRQDKIDGDATAAPRTEVSDRTTVLAELRSDDRDITVYFHEQGRGAAYSARKGAVVRIVHRGKESRPLETVDRLVFSPDGSRIACSASVDGKWRMYIDGTEGLPSDEVSSLASFSPDSRHIAYAVKTGGMWHMVVDRVMDPASRSFLGEPVISAGQPKVVYTEKEKDSAAHRLVITDLSHKRLFTLEPAGPELVLNPQRDRIATVRYIGGKQRVVTMEIGRPEAYTEGPAFDSVSHVVFGSDGRDMAYLGVRGDNRFLVINGKEDSLPLGNIPWPPVVRPGVNSAGVIVSGSSGYFLHQAFSMDAPDRKMYVEVAHLAYSSDGSHSAFAARKGERWAVVVDGFEGPLFDRVVSPVFSPDGTKVVYRARQDGKRFVVVSDLRGKTIKQHPSYEQVFQPVFPADGTSVAYGVKDGNQLIWKVEKL